MKTAPTMYYIVHKSPSVGECVRAGGEKTQTAFPSDVTSRKVTGEDGALLILLPHTDTTLSSYLVLQHQVLADGPEGLGQHQQTVQRQRLPLVLGHHDSAPYLRPQEGGWRYTASLRQHRARAQSEALTARCRAGLP